MNLFTCENCTVLHKFNCQIYTGLVLITLIVYFDHLPRSDRYNDSIQLGISDSSDNRCGILNLGPDSDRILSGVEVRKVTLVFRSKKIRNFSTFEVGLSGLRQDRGVVKIGTLEHGVIGVTAVTPPTQRALTK